MKPNSNKQTILLVDDMKDNLRVLQMTLEPQGYAVLAAPSGEIALKIVATVQPDLILLDVMMPGIDGFETIRRLKENIVSQSLPVIFITAKSDPADVERFFAAGAVDYIGKPFCQKEVCSRVRIHLALQACGQPAAAMPGSPPPDPIAEPRLPLPSSLPKPANPLTVILTNPVLAGLAEVYLADLRAEMPPLKKALGQRDFKGIAKMAHNYSGSGASHGFNAITHLGQALEYTAGQEQEASVVALVASFNDFLSRVCVVRG